MVPTEPPTWTEITAFAGVASTFILGFFAAVFGRRMGKRDASASPPPPPPPQSDHITRLLIEIRTLQDVIIDTLRRRDE